MFSWKVHFHTGMFTLQEQCCCSRALRVTLQWETEIACTCAGYIVYFVVNKRPYFLFLGPIRFYILHALPLIMPIKWPNVSRMCLRYKTSSKLCGFCHILPHFQCRLKHSWIWSIYTSFLIWLSESHVKTLNKLSIQHISDYQCNGYTQQHHFCRVMLKSNRAMLLI